MWTRNFILYVMIYEVYSSHSLLQWNCPIEIHYLVLCVLFHHHTIQFTFQCSSTNISIYLLYIYASVPVDKLSNHLNHIIQGYKVINTIILHLIIYIDNIYL